MTKDHTFRASLDALDRALADTGRTTLSVKNALKQFDALTGSVCTCPRECHCKNPELKDPPGVGDIHGDCPVHGDGEVNPALFGCTSKKHWWE